MVNKNAQDWLNEKYPNKEQVETIDASSLERLKIDQPSKLEINDYPCLKKIDLSLVTLHYRIPTLTHLTIKNCPQLETVSNNKELQRVITQQLIIHNCPRLKRLICPFSGIVDLNLSEVDSLEVIDAWSNELTNFNFLTSLNPKNMTYLIINDNNFLSADLTPFAPLINLKKLWIGNNQFCGSLEPLKNMNKLEDLNIDNTDLDSGLEYLPNNLKEFWCSASQRKDARVKFIEQELRNCSEPRFSNFASSLLNWKKANTEKVKIVQQAQIVQAYPHSIFGSSKK